MPNILRSVIDNKQNSQSGWSVLLMFIMISILLTVATVLFNRMLGNNKRVELKSIADSIAMEAVAQFPDPKAAYKAAYAAYSRLKFNSALGGVAGGPNALRAGLEAVIYMSSSAGDRVELGRFTANGVTGIDPVALVSFNETQVSLPIKSIAVQVREPYQPVLITPLVPSFSVAAESEMATEPTDIVLVIENSSSLITPMSKDAREDWENDPTIWPAEAGVIPDNDFVFESSYSKEQTTPPSPPKPGSLTSFHPVFADRNLTLSPPTTGLRDGHKFYPKDIRECYQPGGTGRGPAQGDYCSLPKALYYTRQCFGEGAKRVKQAGVALYDILSASAMNRVAVVFNQTSYEEQAHVAVKLTTHPIVRNLAFEKNANALFDENNGTNINYDTYGINVDPNQGAGPKDPVTGQTHHPVTLEQPRGDAEFQSTRCAAITDQFPVPPHPLLADAIVGGNKTVDFSVAAGSSGREKLTRRLFDDPNSEGNPNTIGSYAWMYHFVTDFNTPPNNQEILPWDMLRFRSDGEPAEGRYPDDELSGVEPARLLPREIIHMKPMGYMGPSGAIEPGSETSNIQFGILRAMQILKNAPPRKDKLPVRRRVVITITDGFEDRENPTIYAPEQRDTSMPQKVTVNDPDTGAIRYFPWNELDSDVCGNPSNAPDSYKIKDLTDLTAANIGDKNSFKLMMLYYPFVGRGHYPGSTGVYDQHQWQLPDHGAKVSAFNSCSSKSGIALGRSIISSKTANSFPYVASLVAQSMYSRYRLN